MLKAYDAVKIKSTGKLAHIIETDDDGGTKPTIYLVELDDKPKGASVSDVVRWCDGDEIEAV